MILWNVIFISNLEKLEKRELEACGESLILLNTKLFINSLLVGTFTKNQKNNI